MSEYSDMPDRECVRRYYEENDEAAFNAFFGRAGPAVLASLRRFAWSRGRAVGSGTSGIEPEDALQHAVAQLLARRYPLQSSMSVQGWLFAVGRNYMIDPWRPRRFAARIFMLWPGPRSDRESEADSDWLAEQFAHSLDSTFDEYALNPEERLVRELDDAERSRQVEDFRRERDKWLMKNPAYLPVAEIIGSGCERKHVGPGLGAPALETLLGILREEGLLPEDLSPGQVEGIRGYFRLERVGEILYDMTLKSLKCSMEREAEPDRLPLADHDKGSGGRKRKPQRHDAAGADFVFLSMMSRARQRALRLADHGFTGAEIGILDGRTERAGQLLLNRARRQLEELRETLPGARPLSIKDEEMGCSHEFG